jgi:hypothetical protein
MSSILLALRHLALSFEPYTGDEDEIIGFIKARENANMHRLVLIVGKLTLFNEAKEWLEIRVISLHSHGKLL